MVTSQKKTSTQPFASYGKGVFLFIAFLFFGVVVGYGQVEASIDDPSPVAEGDGGTATLTFTVSLDQSDPVNDTNIDYTITGGNEAGS
ncbi:MAG: hypothetical protein RIM83_11895, partial [Allomuricauda sp.]